MSMNLKQTTFGFEPAPYKSAKVLFLEQMERIVPWTDIEALIRPYYPAEQSRPQGGRPAFPLAVMLRAHYLQIWLNLSDEQAQEELYDSRASRTFAGLDGEGGTPDAVTILRFRHMIEKHGLAIQIFEMVNKQLEARGLMLRHGSIVDATIINAPSSTKNKEGKRDAAMHQTNKGEQYYFGMKMHLAVDAESGLSHSVVYTPANVHDVTQVGNLLHGQEKCVWGDAGYRGADKREENRARDIQWAIAMRPGERCKLDKASEPDMWVEQIERINASIRAKVEHVFHFVKNIFGYAKARYRGIPKNASRLTELLTMFNLWKARSVLLA